MSQLPFIVLDSIEFKAPRPVIEKILSTYAPNVQVVGSRITEDGYELVLEGEMAEVATLEYVATHLIQLIQ